MENLSIRVILIIKTKIPNSSVSNKSINESPSGGSLGRESASLWCLSVEYFQDWLFFPSWVSKGLWIFKHHILLSQNSKEKREWAPGPLFGQTLLEDPSKLL